MPLNSVLDGICPVWVAISCETKYLSRPESHISREIFMEKVTFRAYFVRCMAHCQWHAVVPSCHLESNESVQRLAAPGEIKFSYQSPQIHPSHHDQWLLSRYSA